MPSPLTRQDLVAITDGAKNRIIERLITRQDLQGVSDNVRDRILNTINAFHIETQALIRQTGSQHDLMNRRIAALEAQLTAARQDIRLLSQTINRLYEMQAHQLRVISGPSEPAADNTY